MICTLAFPFDLRCQCGTCIYISLLCLNTILHSASKDMPCYINSRLKVKYPLCIYDQPTNQEKHLYNQSSQYENTISAEVSITVNSCQDRYTSTKMRAASNYKLKEEQPANRTSRVCWRYHMSSFTSVSNVKRLSTYIFAYTT